MLDDKYRKIHLARPGHVNVAILHLAGLLMPYLTIGLGLYVFRSAWAAVFGYHLGILVFVTLANAWPRLEAFLPVEPLWKTLLFGLTGCIAGILLYFLWPFLNITDILHAALSRWGLTPPMWPAFILYGALVNPWLEETFWRGWLGSDARHPIWHDAVFAGFHLVILAPLLPPFWSVVAFLVLASSGWLWRQANRAEQSMLASTLFHMAADVSILCAVWSTIP